MRALLAFCARRDTPEGSRDHAMLRLLSATGMRVGELVMVNVERRRLRTSRRVRVVGRGNRERTLPLDDATARQPAHLSRSRLARS